MATSRSSFQDEARVPLLSTDVDANSNNNIMPSLDQELTNTSTILSTDSGDSTLKHGDVALSVIRDARVTLTEDDNRRIRRATDWNILPILIWMYFLQISDKTTLGYAATFGLQKDTNLTGHQYSLVGSIAPIAQLAWQPVSSYIILKVPARICIPIFILGWGIAQACMAACHNYTGLMITRFFLGLFEAGCLPIFSIITSNWYRRSEQPLRVASWYCMNGVGNMCVAALSYGLGHINSRILLPWQIIFLFFGLITIASAPLVYWRIENDIPSCRFLSATDKLKAIERLRANNTGTGTREFKYDQIFETLLDTKTYLFIAMTILLNLGAQVSNTFGPLILNGFGFPKSQTSLLNIPFGMLQFLTILLGSYFAYRFRYKSLILALFMLPVIIGISLLYSLPRNDHTHGPLLLGFYLFSFLFAGNPLIVSWIISNTAGSTKKTFTMSLYQASSSAGNIIGPLLFTSEQAPEYKAGLKAVLGVFSAIVVVVGLQVLNLWGLNLLQGRKRVKNGKSRTIRDRSMETRYVESESESTDGLSVSDEGEGNGRHSGERLGDKAFLDLTDRKNDEFTYVY